MEALRILNDERADRTKQLQILQILGEVRRPDCVPVVLRLACHSSDNTLRVGALTALASCNDPAIATEVLAAYANMSDDVLAAAQSLLVARRPWAVAFLKAIEAGNIDPHSVPREVAERLLLLDDAQISALRDRTVRSDEARHVGRASRRIDRLAAAIGAGPGVPKPGKLRFEQQCATCHSLFSHGGKVGPDLTTYRRDDLENMLLNIVNPSASVREGFTTTVVVTSDGRVLSGVLFEADKNVVILRTADGTEATLARTDIDAMRSDSRSIMPEGLLNGSSDQEVRDLFAYLRSTQPLID